MNKHSRFPRRRPFIPLIILAALALFGLIVMALWNALMPAIFTLPVITYWQAVGLFILSRILLGGFGGFGRRPGGPGGGGRDRRNELMHHMRERWEHMTPEQRERSRRLWKKRWDIDLEAEMPAEPPEG